MKHLILLLSIWSMIMGDEIIVPYPYPRATGDELLAKDITAGAYYASIKMEIINTKTGKSRYVYVPDSPVIDRMENSQDIGSVAPKDIDSGARAYDRDASLEDAVLPKKVQVGTKKPKIVSRALCPQEVTYIGDVQSSYSLNFTSKIYFSRYYDGEEEFMVMSYLTKDTTDGNDEYDLVKVVGTDTKALFHFVGTDKRPYPTQKNGRNFFFSDWKMYEYNTEDYAELVDLTSISDINGYSTMILDDNGNYYAVFSYSKDGYSYAGVINIDSGKVIKSDVKLDDKIDKFNPYCTVDSAIFSNCLGCGICVEDEKVFMVGKYDIRRATAKSRFRAFIKSKYGNNVYNTKYNEKFGVIDYPRLSSFSNFYFLGDIKESYFYKDYDTGNILFSKDFVRYTDTGVKTKYSKGNDFAVITTQYAYISDGSESPMKIKVIRIDKWGMVVPRPDYIELFGKNGLLKNRSYIGGYE